MSISLDRRLYRRVDIRIETRLLGSVLSEQDGFSTVTLDIGEGGFRIAAPEELMLGLEVFFRLRLTDGVDHLAWARVVRSSTQPERPGDTAPWAALAFVDPPESLRAAIRALIASPAGEGAEPLPRLSA